MKTFLNLHVGLFTAFFPPTKAMALAKLPEPIKTAVLPLSLDAAIRESAPVRRRAALFRPSVVDLDFTESTPTPATLASLRPSPELGMIDSSVAKFIFIKRYFLAAVPNIVIFYRLRLIVSSSA